MHDRTDAWIGIAIWVLFTWWCGATFGKFPAICPIACTRTKSLLNTVLRFWSLSYKEMTPLGHKPLRRSLYVFIVNSSLGWRHEIFERLLGRSDWLNEQLDASVGISSSFVHFSPFTMTNIELQSPANCKSSVLMIKTTAHSISFKYCEVLSVY